jgi:hypothetical protein
MLKPWQQKAHAVIAELCAAAWRRTNLDRHGRPYPKHRPYPRPADAQALVECLNSNDEERAKAIFLRLALEA